MGCWANTASPPWKIGLRHARRQGIQLIPHCLCWRLARKAADDQRDPLCWPRCWRRHQRGRRQQPAHQEWRLAGFGQTFITKILLQEHFLKIGQPGISLSGTTFEQDTPGHLLGTFSITERRVQIIEHGLTWRDRPERKNLSLVHHRRPLQWQSAAILHLNGQPSRMRLDAHLYWCRGHALRTEDPQSPRLQPNIM